MDATGRATSLLFFAACLLSIAPAVSYAQTPSPAPQPPVPQSVCALAREHVSEGRLGAATTLLAGGPDEPCRTATRDALAARKSDGDEARARADRFRDIGDSASAAQWYTRARTLNVDDQLALDGLRQTTRVTLRDVGSALIPAAILLIVLIALGRAFGFFFTSSTARGLGERSATTQRWTGVVALAAGAVLATTVSAVWASVTSYVTVALLIVVGFALFGRATALRLWISIGVTRADGTADQAAASYLLARTNTLGSDRPRGLEAPRQLDVTSLPENALSVIPQGRLAVALLAAGRAVLPAAPWQVSVVVLDPDRLTVTVRRNSRQVDSIVVSRLTLGLGQHPSMAAGGPDVPGERGAIGRVELLTATATFILDTLGTAHESLTRGLCGARRWESLALYVLAAEHAALGNPAWSENLLSRSVYLDQKNGLARFSLLVSQGHGWPEQRGQLKIADEMRAERQDLLGDDGRVKVGSEALELRILYAESALRLNHAMLVRQASSQVSPGQEEAVRDTLSTLIQRCSEPWDDPKMKGFVEDMRGSVIYRWRSAVKLFGEVNADDTLAAEVERWDDARLTSARYRYERACFLAIDPSGEEVQEAIDELRLALQVAALREWAPRDPFLASLRSNPTFCQLTAVPERDTPASMTTGR